MTTAQSAATRQTAAQPAAGNLRARTWKRFLRGPDPVLLDELYVPALTEALRYDRCCAYFSSSVLSAAARGFGKLIERLIARGEESPRPAVRLLVNEELDPADVQAMVETRDTTRLEAALTKRFKNPKDFLEKKRLAMLGWMVKTGLLDVRVGVMRHGTGIVHAKFGVVTDEAGNAVVFSGSGNESAKGLMANYERIDVSTSWEDPDRHEEYATEFDRLWGDEDADVHTVTLPEALRLKLIKFAPKEPPIDEPSSALVRQKAAMIWQFIVESPYFPNGGATCDATAMVEMWPHQRKVVEEVAEAWPDGRLLCDEVGMGKTIEAMLILRRLMAGRGVRRALFLLPAGLLKQWQAELREKGGLIFPRLEGLNRLVWPDDREEKVSDLAEALARDVLLMSRETARTERNLPVLLGADPWDLVLLDEAHAARRLEQVEGEFNSGTLLLDLLRQLQLRGRARGILLLSATPMQTHPWEPWDLLGVLGEGGSWLADFAGVRDYYTAIAALKKGQCDVSTATRAANLIADDPRFPDPPAGISMDRQDAVAVANKLAFATASQREELATWLRRGSPLARRMHRNTRNTLRRYYDLGILKDPPPRRTVEDILFDYEDDRERAVYNAVTRYIRKRFEELEGEKPGKGFVMTVYRRRASSSPQALRRSLERRRQGLLSVLSHRAHDYELNRLDVPESVGDDDLPEGATGGRVSAALPTDPEIARAELTDVDGLLAQLESLGAVDSKSRKFFEQLRRITEDGRSALVFTEYTDTMKYLRDVLVCHYDKRLGCYSGEGGRIWDGTAWKHVTKDAITKSLHDGELSILICTDAASEGLNLQAAGALVNYDLPWNPGKIEQRIGRIDRIGQKYSIIWIVNLFLKNSVDERVYRVLRTRCRLFEHFVGAMQPVLARAKRLLMGGGDGPIDELNSAADEVDHDPLAAEIYLESGAEASTPPGGATTREDLKNALRLLDGSFGPSCRAGKENKVLSVSGGGVSRIRLSVEVEALEADRRVLPLSPLLPRLRDLAASLVRPGERLPLVIGSYQDGPFRTSFAFWVEEDALIPVDSAEQLRRLVSTWDGQYPNPVEWKRASSEATRMATSEVQGRIRLAAGREAESRERQSCSARLRLTRELGRYLVCAGGSTDDLNEVFHKQMSRDTDGARRLRRCYETFGGYPVWTVALRDELMAFHSQLTKNRRQARLMANELEAALMDPRWGR